MEEDISILSAALSELLAEQERWSEHALISRLQQPPYEIFESSALSDTMSLFKTHFMVFHCLYLLRSQWRREKVAELDIHTLAIHKKPWQSGLQALQPTDPLADYYLDLTQLTGTAADDVEQWLDDFWQQMAGRPQQRQSTLSYAEACDIMQLQEPFSTVELKRQYRRLIHQYHPDKGGSSQQMLAVKEAYQTLLNPI